MIPEEFVGVVAMANYGTSLSRLGRFEEAESPLVDSYKILSRLHGRTNEQSIKTARLLADLYDKWGKPAKASEYRALASADGSSAE